MTAEESQSAADQAREAWHAACAELDRCRVALAEARERESAAWQVLMDALAEQVAARAFG